MKLLRHYPMHFLHGNLKITILIFNFYQPQINQFYYISIRQLIRICRRLTLFPSDSLYNAIHRVSLSRFLPSLAKMALEELMANNGILPPEEKVNFDQVMFLFEKYIYFFL